MAIGRPEASDATSPRGPRRARDGVRIATAAQRRTAQARLCCFARNDGDPGSPRSARGGRRQGKKVGTSRCGIGARGAAVLRPDQAIEEAVWSGHWRTDDGEVRPPHRIRRPDRPTPPDDALSRANLRIPRPANVANALPQGGSWLRRGRRPPRAPILPHQRAKPARRISAPSRPSRLTRTLCRSLSGAPNGYRGVREESCARQKGGTPSFR